MRTQEQHGPSAKVSLYSIIVFLRRSACIGEEDGVDDGYSEEDDTCAGRELEKQVDESRESAPRMKQAVERTTAR